MELSEEAVHPVRPKRRKRLILLSSIAAILVAGWLVAPLITARYDHTQDARYFAGLQKETPFPIYYAPNAPPGLVLDKQSVTHNNEVVLYDYTYGTSSKKLIVSIQPIDSSFDTDNFHPDQDFITYIGHAYMVDLEDRTTAAIVTNKSLVLINAPQKIPQDTMVAFINSLRSVL